MPADPPTAPRRRHTTALLPGGARLRRSGPRDERRPGPLPVAIVLATLVLAVLLLPSAARADVPIIDWTDRPDAEIVLADGWSIRGCDGDAPLLCTWEQGRPQGAVEHLTYPLGSYEDLRNDLATGVDVRTALIRYIDTSHAVFRADRSQTWPEGHTYRPDPTVGAIVAGLDGARWGFVVLDADGRLVERVVGFMTVREDGSGGAVDLVVASEIDGGAYQSTDDGTVFSDGSLGRFTPHLTQLVARAHLGPGSEGVLQLPHDVHLQAADAVETAIQLSQLAVPDDRPAGAPDGTVLVARDDVFADALAAGGAQGALDAPLLLTGGDRLDDRTATEIGRLGAARAIVLGGEDALAPQVVADLESLDLTVTRLAGPDRVATALAIADVVAPEAERIVVVRADAGDGSDPSRAFADSLAAGALAAAQGAPVLLTAGDALDDRVAAWIEQRGLDGRQIEQAVVAGGESAIAQPVLQRLVETGVGLHVAGGTERAETATLLDGIRQLPSAAHADAVILVDGHAWIDGLASGLLSSRALAPVLLTDGDGLPVATRAFLDAADPTEPPRVICTPSVSATACDAAGQVVRGA